MSNDKQDFVIGRIDPPVDTFQQALKETDTRLSIMINYYNDGQIEYTIEHDKEHYGQKVDLGHVIGLIYHAAELIISNSKGETDANEEEDGE